MFSYTKIASKLSHQIYNHAKSQRFTSSNKPPLKDVIAEKTVMAFLSGIVLFTGYQAVRIQLIRMKSKERREALSNTRELLGDDDKDLPPQSPRP